MEEDHTIFFCEHCIYETEEDLEIAKKYLEVWARIIKKYEGQNYEYKDETLHWQPPFDYKYLYQYGRCVKKLMFEPKEAE